MRRRFTTVAVSARLGLLGLALLGAGPACAKPLAPEPGYAEICERVAQRLPRVHLLHLDMGDAISSRTWTNLVTSFDYERLYFLQSDIDRLRTRELTLDDALRDGDMAFAIDVFELFKQRLSNRVAYVSLLLTNGFDCNLQESFVWERKDAPWAADEAAWNEIWRQRIKNEYLRALLAREEAARTNRVAAADAPAPADPGATHPPAAAHGDATAALPAPLPATTATASNAPARPTDSIEAGILRRYRQAQLVIEDSDAELLLQRYLNAFTQAYDPHSAYFTPSAMRDFEIDMNLALFGIGALLSAEDGAAKIERLIPGGPAARDTRDIRLQVGDKIIAVAQDDGEPVDVLHWPLHKIVSRIRGEKGTRVVLTVIPQTDPSGSVTKRVDLVRDEVKLEDQAASGRVRTHADATGHTNRIGVVKLPAFYGSMGARSPGEPGFRSAVYDVIALLTDFRTQQVDGVILDLRGNGGGALVEAIDMTGLFIRRGPTVQVKERFFTRALDDEDPRVLYDGPLLVLVNRLSASASEIVAGALQDYGRAIVVGDSKTHGKGTVQSLLGLAQDETLGQLKVTTASYIRISGASTQRQGISPDIVVPSPLDFLDTGEEFLPNAMPPSLERPANYRPVADLSPLLPRLREQSEDRRRTSETFQAYARLLERIAILRETQTLSLNLDERRRQAEVERELTELQDRLTADGGDAEPADETDAEAELAARKDLVLTEALAILGDFIRLQQEPTLADLPPADTQPAQVPSFAPETGSVP